MNFLHNFIVFEIRELKCLYFISVCHFVYFSVSELYAIVSLIVEKQVVFQKLFAVFIIIQIVYGLFFCLLKQCFCMFFVSDSVAT